MDASFFKRNRDKIAGTADGRLVVLSGYTQMQRGNDAAFAFEQEANFWYLTGIDSPDWWVIIDGIHSKTWLVCPLVNQSHHIFDGSLSKESARAISGVDDIISQDEALLILVDLARHQHVVQTIGEPPHAEHFDFTLNPTTQTTWKMLEDIFENVVDCRLELAKLRAVKQPEEIIAIKQAVKLSVEAFEHVRLALPLLKFEYEIEAEFTYQFRKNGASGHAYDPIVASGKNACTLHYGKNQDPLVTADLVLLDVGARLHGYPADITRTYAIGEVSQRHKAVHAEVVKAHQQIVALLRPGLRVKDYFSQVDIIMQLALENLNLLKTKDDYRKYFPHSISHGLGIDVHDSLGNPETFQPGMILTVEPGIYIPEETIGVRIEDDILITSTGHENLSGSLSTDL
jgi:Xaa-Pro aminopeptidase